MKIKPRSMILSLLLLFLPLQLHAQTYPRGDGMIRFYNYHLNQFAEIQLRKGNGYNPEGIQQVQMLLRSREDASAIFPIDPELLDLVDFLQDHFGADTIEIISGFRSKQFNESLLKNGHKVSPVSRHMEGKALDIHIDEIKEETLRDYLLSLGLGGVGYYGPLDFIHIDKGPVRSWSEANSTRKLVGVLDPEAPVQLTSDRNDYLPEDYLFFTWNFSKEIKPDQIESIHLERFFRGEWISCLAPEAPPSTSQGLLPSAFLCKAEGKQLPPFGKYRWVFKIKGQEDVKKLSSNEFYLKKE